MRQRRLRALRHLQRRQAQVLLEGAALAGCSHGDVQVELLLGEGRREGRHHVKGEHILGAQVRVRPGLFAQDEPLVYLRLGEVDDVDEVLVLLQEEPIPCGPSDYDKGDGVALLGVGRVQEVERVDGRQGHQEHAKPPAAVGGIVGRIKNT